MPTDPATRGPFTTRSFAPGRVNLIGEHVDYHGLSVLPMALHRGITVDFRPRGDGQVVLANADPRFGERRFSVTADLEAGPPGDWGNYAMAAAVTVAREYGARTGIEGELGSTLPPAAGLSSSSALVVAVAQALLHASEISVDPVQLAQALAEGERFVGTAGGGMDQAASLLGRAHCAVRISFEPLAASPVRLPADWAVVVAHTGVSAEKSGGAQEAYNARRRESTAALEAVAEAVGMAGARPRAVVDRLPVDDLVEAASALDAPGGPWAVHALTEAARVREAESVLEAGDIHRFGELLNASHASLRDVYGVSHLRLDALVEAARGAGASGARLTGAGFGGCMLAVCTRDSADAVVAGLRAAQNAMDPPAELPPFVAQPGDGARVTPAE